MIHYTQLAIGTFSIGTITLPRGDHLFFYQYLYPAQLRGVLTFLTPPIQGVLSSPRPHHLLQSHIS